MLAAAVGAYGEIAPQEADDSTQKQEQEQEDQSHTDIEADLQRHREELTTVPARIMMAT